MSSRPALLALSPSVDFALTRLSGLAALGPDDEAALHEAAQAFSVIPARREILKEGDPIRQARILLDGWAYRSRILPDGRRQILHILLPGDLVGMCHQSTPVALTTMTALTDVVMCPAPDPCTMGKGEGLAEAYAASRMLEEKHLLHQITRLGRMSASERIVDWVLETGERLAAAGVAPADDFALPLIQEMIGDMLGLTSVHVNRMVQAMLRDGLLRVRGGRATVLDRKRCEQLVDYTRRRFAR
jgi:CRP-like cAMP-binding protein